MWALRSASLNKCSANFFCTKPLFFWWRRMPQAVDLKYRPQHWGVKACVLNADTIRIVAIVNEMKCISMTNFTGSKQCQLTLQNLITYGIKYNLRIRFTPDKHAIYIKPRYRKYISAQCVKVTSSSVQHWVKSYWPITAHLVTFHK